MRYKRQLNRAQMEYLIKNSHLSNTDLGNKFNVAPSIIATYKARARRAGIPLIKTQRKKTGCGEVMKEIAKEGN